VKTGGHNGPNRGLSAWGDRTVSPHINTQYLFIAKGTWQYDPNTEFVHIGSAE
jgi:hypothetical protein